MTLKTIRLRKGKTESLKRFHPWIFSGAIDGADPGIEEGDLVRVVDASGNFLAIGHCQIGSIAVRVLSFTERPIDSNFWTERLAEAYALRRSLHLAIANEEENNIFRLVHGEGDRLPGLVVDVYGRTAVMQAHTVGMHVCRKEIAAALIEACEGRIDSVYYKSDTTLPFKAEVDRASCFLIGGSNAELAHSVDSSAKAIDLTNANVALNFPAVGTRHEAFAEDAFKFLEHAPASYDLIILDPPAFAKHRGAIAQALKGYTRLNAIAFKKIQPGGIIFTFSCSQAVNKEQFRLAVFTAAAQSGRHVRILHQLHQPADHPVNIYHPEGEYLKGLVLQVE